MSKLKELIKGSPVHERRLELRTYPLENDRLVVEGWLRDERLVKGFHWNGEPRLPGVVHHMCVRMLIAGWPVTILDAEAEMPETPHKLCPETLDSVKKIIGLQIVSGYSEKVNHLLGGVRGCNHLTHLILVMGTAALHGYWTHYSRVRHPIPGSMEEFRGLSSLINSCSLWGEDGPIMKQIRETLKDARPPSTSPAKNGAPPDTPKDRP
ncbi:MAG: DUF2889 domain-containing protein [Deltaproteobacteria bacterium]|nr:DUF2889 domain-containing protein [Deltaproteobacteria bacterium]